MGLGCGLRQDCVVSLLAPVQLVCGQDGKENKGEESLGKCNCKNVIKDFNALCPSLSKLLHTYYQFMMFADDMCVY